MKQRHVPQRTCIGCRETEAKRGLVRVIRTPDGRVEIDPTGKKAGRGAYIHQIRRCWDEALKKDRLSRALRVAVPPPDRETLRAFAETLEAADSSA